MYLISYRFFHSKVVCLPNIAGLLLLSVISAAGFGIFVYSFPSFLAINSPVRHGLLIVEGWVSHQSLIRAAETFQQGHYDRLVVSGGPIEDSFRACDFRTYAERAAYELKLLGIDGSKLIVVPAPASAQDRTYRSVISVRQTLDSLGMKVTAFDVLSSGPHTRRSRNLYQLAFGEHVDVGAIAAQPSYDLSHWWRSSAGVKDILGESIAYFWTLCCFDPGQRGSWEESWGKKHEQ